MDKVQSCGCGKKYVSTVTTFAETIFRECIFAAIGEILKTQLQTRAHRCSFVPTHLLHFGISQMKESQSTDNMLKTLTLLIWPWWVRLPMKMMKMMTTQVLPIMILSALHYIADTLVSIFSCPESVSHSTSTFDIQRGTSETFDRWNIWSEWWEDMTWPKKIYLPTCLPTYLVLTSLH